MEARAEVRTLKISVHEVLHKRHKHKAIRKPSSKPLLKSTHCYAYNHLRQKQKMNDQLVMVIFDKHEKMLEPPSEQPCLNHSVYRNSRHDERHRANQIWPDEGTSNKTCCNLVATTTGDHDAQLLLVPRKRAEYSLNAIPNLGDEQNQHKKKLRRNNSLVIPS